MKRVLLVLPLVGVASWAGATMFAGEQSKSAYDELLGQLRVQHGLNVQPLEYDKSFLDSNVKTVVNGNLGSLSGGQDQDLPEALRFVTGRFVLNHYIEHGPVVLSNGLQALAGKIKTTVDMDSLDPEFAAKWKQACACDEPIILNSEISLQGQYAHNFEVKAFDWREGSSQISFDGMRSTSRVDSDKTAYGEGQTGELVVSNSEKDSQLTIAAGTWQLSGREHIKNVVVGDLKFDLPSISFISEGAQTQILGVQFLANSDVKAGAVHSVMDFGAASIKGGKVDLGESHFDVAVTGVPAGLLTSFSERLSGLNLSEGDASIELLKVYRDSLVPGLGLSYGLRTEKPAKGKFSASLAMKFAPIGGRGLADMETVGELFEAAKADFLVDIDEQMLQELPAAMSQNPMFIGMLKQAENGYALEARLANGQALLNDTPYPLAMMLGEKLQEPLPSLEQMAMLMEANN